MLLMPALLKRRLVQVPTSTSGTNAEKPFDPFSRFGPLKKVPIRDPPKKNRLAELRKLRDLLKSGNLTPEQIRSMLEHHQNLTAFQAVVLAEKEGSLLVPNIVHDRILSQTSTRYQSWTGTLVIYGVPDKPFGKTVVSNFPYSLSFQTPEEHRGKANCALVIEYPDFTLVKTGETRCKVKLTDGAVVHLVENFPKASGWYAQNEFGIPYGNPEPLSPETRYVWRVGAAHISLMRRRFLPLLQWVIFQSDHLSDFSSAAFIV